MTPRKGYVEIQSNIITRFAQGIGITTDNHGSFDYGDPFGINFIETPNSIGLSEENSGNDIIDCETSYYFSSNFFENTLAGLNVEG